MAPFWALIFSACCLAEPPTSKQVIVLTFIVALAMGFVFSGDQESNVIRLDDETKGTVIFAWLCLMVSPVGIATGQALNRVMRKLNENTTTIYSNFVSIFIWLTVMLAIGQDVAIFMEFNWI